MGPFFSTGLGAVPGAGLKGLISPDSIALISFIAVAALNVRLVLEAGASSGLTFLTGPRYPNLSAINGTPGINAIARSTPSSSFLSLRYLYLANPAPASSTRRIHQNHVGFTGPFFLPVAARAAITGVGVGVGVGVPSPVSVLPPPPLVVVVTEASVVSDADVSTIPPTIPPAAPSTMFGSNVLVAVGSSIVSVGLGASVSTGALVFVGFGAFVFVGLGALVFVGLGASVFVFVGTGVFVAFFVGTGVFVAFFVGTGVFVAFFVGLGVGVFVAFFVGVGVFVFVGLGVSVGLGAL